MKDTSKHIIEEVQYSLLPDEPKVTTSADKVTTPETKSKSAKNSEDNKVKNEEIKNLPLSKLTAFENHPFRVTQDDDFQKLVDSIKENGILIPAVARPKGDDYELISGHRREFACRILGIDTMPVVVRNLTDEQSVVAMVDSNVQRENILPSEKAFAYKMKLEALKRQAGRPKDNSDQVGQNFKGKASRDLLAQNSKDSSMQIQRYIRLTELIPQIISMVDEKKIAFNPAVELSYLPKEQQEALLSAMEAEQSTPSLVQAQKLKAMSADGKLTEDSMMEVMREQKANQTEQLRIPLDKVKAIIKKDIKPKEIEELFMKFLTEHQRKLTKQQNKDAR
jgi:ParB family chromosome partitioning protein